MTDSQITFAGSYGCTVGDVVTTDIPLTWRERLWAWLARPGFYWPPRSAQRSFTIMGVSGSNCDVEDGPTYWNGEEM